MEYLRKEIFDTIEDNDLDVRDVARSIGLTPRYFEYFRSGERNIGFRYIIKLSFVVSPNSPHKKLSEWCLRFDSTELIKNSFEYAAITRNVELLGCLLELHNDATGTIKECVNIYGIIYQFMNDKLKYEEMLDMFCELKSIKDKTLQILLDIFKCIGLFHQKRFLTIPDNLYEVELRIKKISEKRELFLKECFLHRLSEIACHTHLHLNNLPLARHYAKILVNAEVNQKVKSEAMYVIGMSYFFDTPNKCLSYLEKSVREMELTNIDFMIEYSHYNLNCAKLYLDIELPSDADSSLLMFEKYKKGEVTKEAAKEVVDQSGDPDLIMLFDGISGDSTESLYGKYHEFVSDANLYFAAIVVKELIKRGEKSAFVNSLTKLKLNVFKKGDVLFEENYINCFNNRDIINGSNCA